MSAPGMKYGSAKGAWVGEAGGAGCQCIFEPDTEKTRWLPAATWWTYTASAPTLIIRQYANLHDIEMYEVATGDYLFTLMPMPDNWRVATNIRFTIVWTSNAGAGQIGNSVEWIFGAGAFSDGDSLNQNYLPDTGLSDAFQGTHICHIPAKITATVRQSPAPIDMLMLRVGRDQDDFDDDADFIGVQMEYDAP